MTCPHFRGSFRPKAATFMRLRVSRVTPCAVKGCASIGRGARAHRPARCAARVCLPAVVAVSPSVAEPFPLQWPQTSDEHQIPPKLLVTPAAFPTDPEMTHDGVPSRAVLRRLTFLTGA